MLVKFTSTETGEILMFAELARTLLQAVGKACQARGVFTQPEMAAAAKHLRAAVERGEAPAETDEDDSEEAPLSLSARAWPFVDMLERTAKGGEKAHIVWKASSDF